MGKSLTGKVVFRGTGAKTVLQAGMFWVWLGKTAFPGITKTQNEWVALKREKTGKEDCGELRKTLLMQRILVRTIIHGGIITEGQEAVHR